MRYLSALLIISLFSCSPVKQVLKDKDKFDQVAEEVIRRGYCANDTITVTEVKDSVVYKDSIVNVFKPVPCRDFDTSIKGARISIRSGVLTYSAKDSIIYRTNTVINTVVDRSREKVLLKDLDSSRAELNSVRKELVAEIKNSQSLKEQARWSKIYMWIVIAISLIIIFRKPIVRWLYLKW